jgi:uncharacterized membrane protein (GlpM family)
LIKVALSLIVIFIATGIARRFPSTAGLVAVMPLTSVLVMIWVYVESKGDQGTMEVFAKGALIGIIPSVLFFLVAFLCLRKQLSLPATLLVSFAAWFISAAAHVFPYEETVEPKDKIGAGMMIRCPHPILQILRAFALPFSPSH